jgi:hypothetical protein
MLPTAQWVSVKEAAAIAQVHHRTMQKWCAAQRVKARRLACGTGPLRVAIDADGLPADCQQRSAHSKRRR